MNREAGPSLPGEEPLVATVVGLDSNIHSFARESASNKLHQKTESGGKLTRIGRRIWYGNIARDFYLERYTREARQQIIESGNLFVNEVSSNDVVSDQNMREAVTQRFVSEYEDLIRQDETKVELSDDGEQGEFKDVIKSLIARYARGELDDDSFQEEKLRVLHAEVADKGNRDYLKSGSLFADNLLDIARQVRARCDHDSGQANVDVLVDSIRVTSGEAKVGASTEVRRTAVDRIIEKTSGVFVNEATVGAVVAASMSLAKGSGYSLVGAVTRSATLGAGSGIIAGLRENARFKEERLLHSRDVAMGRSFDTNNRRDQLAEAMYFARSASDIRSSIDDILDQETGAVRDNFDEDDFRAGLNAITDVKSRIAISDREKVDLIRFSSTETIETERLEVMIALAKGTARLREWFDNQSDQVKQSLLAGKNDFDEIMQATLSVAETNLITDISAKDKLFAKMKRKRIAKMATAAALVGSAVGLASQEVSASMSDSTQGMLERLWQDNPDYSNLASQTTLDRFFHAEPFHAGFAYEYIPLTGSNQVIGTNGGSTGSFEIDQAFAVSQNGNTFDITTPEGNVISGVGFDHDGTLDSASLRLLTDNNIKVGHSTSLIEHETTTQVDVDVEGLIKNHENEFTRITRDGWYDNDTPKPIFDYNELRVHWGGQGGTGIDADGNFVYDVSHMTRDGSWHGSESVAWQDAAQQGNLKIAISLDAKNQNNVLMVDVNEYGQAVIDKDSMAGRAFDVRDGRAVFIGKYAEVSEITGVDSSGVVHTKPLATDVGRGLGQMQDTIVTKYSEVLNHYSFEYIQPPPVMVEPDVLPVPNIPIVPRETLTPWRVGRREQYRPYYGEYRLSPEEEQYYASERSPRLNRDPNAILNPNEELRWFRSELRKRRGRSYVREIDNIINDTEELKKLPPELKTIYTIPVAAVQEHDNIYKVLSLYAQQDRDAIDKSTILLHLNWLGDQISNRKQARNIQKTRSEIERAKNAFPHLNIAVIETEYDREQVDRNGGGIIGHVAKKMIDTALLSVESAMRGNRINKNQDVLIVRNDADMMGMARNHMRQMQKSLDANRGTDVFKGSTRFGTPFFERYPGFGIVTNFSSALSVASSAEGNIHIGGANFGIRASTMAAIGGVGFDERSSYTGVGSDDVGLGQRIMSARRNINGRRGQRARSYLARSMGIRLFGYGYGRQGADGATDRKFIMHPAGTSIDTNPIRLIPPYLSGHSFQYAWSGGQFDKDGYSGRDTGIDIMRRKPREDLTNSFDEIIEHMEININYEISVADSRSAKRALALFFGLKPGIYTLQTTADGVRFKFTDVGRAFIRERIEKESDGRIGSYGHRQMRRLYNKVAPGGRRPVAQNSPLVAPL